MDSAHFIKNRALRRNVRAYWVLIVFIVAAMGYYSYINFAELFNKSELINAHHEALATIEPLLDKEESEYQTVQDSKQEMYQNLKNDIDFVLPEAETYTNLTRELDDFFLGLSRSDNPIFVSNLQYGAPYLDPTENYNILPINLTITSSKENFFTFLDYVENSGSLSDKIRLLDIQSIKINFKQASIGEEESNVSLSVSMNSYFQKENS